MNFSPRKSLNKTTIGYAVTIGNISLPFSQVILQYYTFIITREVVDGGISHNTASAPKRQKETYDINNRVLYGGGGGNDTHCIMNNA